MGAVCGLLLLPSVAFGASMIASGWGEAGVDGAYTEGASVNGFPSYSQGGFTICHMDINHTWEIGTDGLCIDGAGDPPVYYSDDIASTPDGVGTWIANTGANPTGTITAGASGGVFDVSVAVIGSSSSAVTDWFTGSTGIAYLLVIFGALVGLGVGIYLFRKLVGRNV